IEPFVGEWHVHGSQLVVKADQTGTELWNAGPCESTASLCIGYATDTFTLDGDVLVGRVTSVVYKDQDTGTVRTDAGVVASGPHVGDTFRLKVWDKGVLKYVDERFQYGNPYLCRADASPK